MGKLGLKILALPVCLILSILSVFMELLVRAYSLGAGLLINFIVICLVLAIISQQWLNFGILAGIFGVIAVLTLCVGLVAATVEIWRDRLKNFIAK